MHWYADPPTGAQMIYLWQSKKTDTPEQPLTCQYFESLPPSEDVRWLDLMKAMCQQHSCCELVHLCPPSPASGSNSLLECPQHDVLCVIGKAVWNGCPILGWSSPICSFSALWSVLRFCISHHLLYKKASTIRIKSYTLLEVKTCIFGGQLNSVFL